MNIELVALWYFKDGGMFKNNNVLTLYTNVLSFGMFWNWTDCFTHFAKEIWRYPFIRSKKAYARASWITHEQELLLFRDNIGVQIDGFPKIYNSILYTPNTNKNSRIGV